MSEQEQPFDEWRAEAERWKQASPHLYRALREIERLNLEIADERSARQALLKQYGEMQQRAEAAEREHDELRAEIERWRAEIGTAKQQASRTGCEENVLRDLESGGKPFRRTWEP